MTRVLVIDNYDSFVYNLVQYLAQLGVEQQIWRNDDPHFNSPGWVNSFDGILLSPGPGTPQDAGVCVEVVRQLGTSVPIFGVCLGLQAIAVAYGGVVTRAPEPRHGKTSPINHDGRGVFAELPSPLIATRYHSLALQAANVPDCLQVSATTPGPGDQAVIMAVRHRSQPVEAVQFHPESVLTQGGHRMLANWLASCGDADAVARAKGLAPLLTS